MNSFIGWVGGKRLLRKAVCERFPAGISKYVEVFGGAAWVLFYLDRHAPFEVYNDVNGELVNLFRCVKHHPDAVARELDYLLNAREIFDYFKHQSTEGLTDIQRAARYYYLIKASYGTKLCEFSARPRGKTWLDGFRDIRERLQSVIIENRSFDTLISRYDSPETLFYCDPPYYGAEGMYDKSYPFGDEQHKALKAVLSSIKGRFILSYNECEFIRNLYEGFSIEAVSRHNSLAARYGADKDYKELIIRNY